MRTLHRAQILLEPEHHRTLAEITHHEGRSISDLVHEIVGQYLAEQNQKARLQREIQAIEELTHIRKQLQEQHGVYRVDLVTEMRAEREQDTADRRLANGARQAGATWVHWIEEGV
jgi:hypothetical protein